MKNLIEDILRTVVVAAVSVPLGFASVMIVYGIYGGDDHQMMRDLSMQCSFLFGCLFTRFVMYHREIAEGRPS
jgi:hypothetical protein